MTAKTTNPALITAYEYDESGYLTGTTLWQWLAEAGQYAEAPNSTLEAPWGEGQPDASVFYRRVAGKWTTEKKPTCAADLVGVVVSHTSQTPHDVEMRQLVQAFSAEEGYKQVRGEALSWMIEKIPEKTEAEKLAEAEQSVRAKRDSLISQTDYLLASDYPISEEDLEAVKTYRQALRDVPQQAGFPYDVEWPEAPAFLSK